MKTKIITLAVALIATVMSLQAEVRRYAGNVGQYDVTARLVVEPGVMGGEDWSGTYTYTKAGNTLNVTGGCNSLTDWDIVLDEYTPKGNNSATWTLREYSDGSLRGVMYVYSSRKTFKVHLKRKK